MKPEVHLNFCCSLKALATEIYTDTSNSEEKVARQLRAPIKTNF